MHALQPMHRRTSSSAPVRRLAWEIGVGDERARHPDRLERAAGDEPVGRDGVDDARRAHERRPDPEPGVVADGVLGEGRRGHDAHGAQVRGGLAERDADVVDAARQLADDVPGGLRIRAQPHAEREAPRRSPNRLEHGEEEASRLGPLVVAPVQAGREELRREVVVGGRDLDPVEAGGGNVGGRARVALDDRLDVRLGSGARLDVEAAARDGRRGDRGSAGRARDLLAAAVEELDEKPRSVRPHGLGDAGEPGGRLFPVAREGVRSQEPGRVDGRRLEDDQPDAAPSPRLVVGDEVVGRKVVVDERRLVGGRDDPVPQPDRPDQERAEELVKHARARPARRP